MCERGRGAGDWLDKLCRAAQVRVEDGYYEVKEGGSFPGGRKKFSERLSRLDSDSFPAVVAEVKPRSPSRGDLLSERARREGLEWLAGRYEEGGAQGLSVLTDPDYFGGSLENLGLVAGGDLPVLMKDFVLAPVQLQACAAWGGDAVLLIKRSFDRDYSYFSLREAIEAAHRLGLETLLEVYSEREYRAALRTEADMIGINNRDLRSLRIDLTRTAHILEDNERDRPVWTLSGVRGRKELKFLARTSVEAVLIGSCLASASDPADKLISLRGDLEDELSKRRA